MYNMTPNNKYLILILIFAFGITAQIYAQDRNTVLLFSFDTVENGVVIDQSDEGNNGVIVGATQVDGKIGQGLSFGGNEAGDFIEVANNDSLSLEDGFTIELWFILNSDPTAGGVGVTKSSSYKVGPRNNPQAELRFATTEAAFGQDNILSATPLPLNQWVHLAGSYDAESGVAAMYIDGELEEEKDVGGTVLVNDNVIWIGRGGTPFLDGILDEVRISNVARSQQEIQRFMEFGVDKTLSVDSQNKLATTWGALKHIR